MFTLTEDIVESLIFAMENQNEDSFVDVPTGAVVSLSGSGDDAVADEGADLVAPPEWSSGDGFRLMESYARTVSDPQARLSLVGALSRGRGVFRAFKDSLAPYPELERRWYEYKTAAMGRRVEEWYDRLRVARGLERLGPEPEETADLLAGDYTIRREGRAAWEGCKALFLRGLEEALGRYPEALVEYEYTMNEREIEAGGPDDLCLYLAEAGPDGLAGMAAVRRVFVAERSFGKLVYLYVSPEHRNLGLGRLLLERAREDSEAEGIIRFIVDMPFLPDGFGRSLQGFGYEAFGTRWIRSGG